jgi:acyl carrier protein
MTAATMQNDISERVFRVVTEVLKVTPEKIASESRYKEDLGADSLDTVTLLMALEDEFKAQISDEKAAQLTTVGATVDFISTAAKVAS